MQVDRAPNASMRLAGPGQRSVLRSSGVDQLEIASQAELRCRLAAKAPGRLRAEVQASGADPPAAALTDAVKPAVESGQGSIKLSASFGDREIDDVHEACGRDALGMIDVVENLLANGIPTGGECVLPPIQRSIIASSLDLTCFSWLPMASSS